MAELICYNKGCKQTKFDPANNADGKKTQLFVEIKIRQIIIFKYFSSLNILMQNYSAKSRQNCIQ